MPRISSSSFRLRGITLPDGETRDCFVVDGRIAFDPAPGAVTLHEGSYLTPGLVNCHAHLTILSPAGDGAPLLDQARASARRNLAAGVLAIREPLHRSRRRTAARHHRRRSPDATRQLFPRHRRGRRRSRSADARRRRIAAERRLGEGRRRLAEQARRRTSSSTPTTPAATSPPSTIPC